MIGTPIIGVMAFIGIIMPLRKVTLMSVQSNAVAAPASMVTGKSREWSLVLSAKRAMWGTTSPKKPIGPQKAVTTAVSTPVMSNSKFRVDFVLTPKF